MLARLKSFLSRWAHARGGNVAMIFALALFPMTLLAGGAVDYNTAMNARTRLSQALDAAALAVGVHVNMDEETSTQMAADFIAANYPNTEIGVVQNITVSIDPDSDKIVVAGQARSRPNSSA